MTDQTETKPDYATLSMVLVRNLDMLTSKIAALDPSSPERKEAIETVGEVITAMARAMDARYEEFLHETSGRVPSLPHNRLVKAPTAGASAFPEDHYYVVIELPRGDVAYPYLGTDEKFALAIYETQSLRVAAGVLRSAILVTPGRILRLGVRRLHGTGAKPVKAPPSKMPKAKAKRA